MEATASTIFLLLILSALLLSPSFAIKRSYVVYLGAHSHAADVSSVDFDRVTDSHNEFLGRFWGRRRRPKRQFSTLIQDISMALLQYLMMQKLLRYPIILKWCQCS